MQAMFLFLLLMSLIGRRGSLGSFSFLRFSALFSFFLFFFPDRFSDQIFLVVSDYQDRNEDARNYGDSD